MFNYGTPWAHGTNCSFALLQVPTSTRMKWTKFARSQEHRPLFRNSVMPQGYPPHSLILIITVLFDSRPLLTLKYALHIGIMTGNLTLRWYEA